MKSNKIRINGLSNGLSIYLPFTKNVIKDNLAYKGTFYLTIICKVLSVLVTYYLWKAIFDSSSNGILGGLTRTEMVTYIFMSFVCSNIVIISMTTKIGNDVTDGSIAMNLIKPISYKRKLLSESIGEMIYKFFIPSIFIWIGVEAYKILNINNYSFSIKSTIFFCISSILGFFVYFLFEFCFGMLVFYSTYVWGMEIIKNGVLFFLTGQLIPLNFFPMIIQKLFNFLPFSSMNYIPVMIYLGKIDNVELVYTLIRQLIWIIILEIFSSWLWKRVIKRISILGG